MKTRLIEFGRPTVTNRLLRARIGGGVAVVFALAALAAVPTSSANASAIRIKKAGAPTNLTVTPVNTAIVVSWSAPLSDGGSPITQYVAQVTAHYGTKTCDTTSLSCTFSGLTNGTRYSVRVQAQNVRGLGKPAKAKKIVPTTAANCTYIGPYANLEYCDLANVNLQGDDLATANLFGVSSGGITGTPVSLPTNWSLVMGYLIGPTAYLEGASLEGATLTNADLAGADLTGANLTGAILSTAYLYEAVLNNADLAGADLSQVNAIDAQVLNVNFSNANLTLGEVAASNVTGSNFDAANLTQADLDNDTLANVTLTDAQLKYASLNYVTSGGIVGVPATLPAGWGLFDGYLVGSIAYLPGADLTGADLTGYNLTHDALNDVNFSNANLTDVDLDFAELVGANLSGANLTGVSWDDTQCPDGTYAYQDGDTCANNLG